MTYKWFKLFSLTEFQATGLVTRELTRDLVGIGTVNILISVGNLVSITYDGHLLPINFLGNNPFVRGQYAVYIDSENFVWLGIEI
jgi:hypothetical protein